VNSSILQAVKLVANIQLKPTKEQAKSLGAAAQTYAMTGGENASVRSGCN
jgi:hypothetical protein